MIISGFSNATLFIKTLSSKPDSFDTATGEPIFKHRVTELKISIDQDDDILKNIQVGVDNWRTYLTGRVVEKGSLTKELRMSNPMRLQLKVSDDYTIEGNFELIEVPKSRFNLESIFGDRIEGWFSGRVLVE